MATSLTNLEKAITSLDGLSVIELEALKSLATARIEKLAVNHQECHFLKLSAELRNKIYSMVANDLVQSICQGKKTTNGLAFANKQISEEYLGIRDSDKTVSAKYLRVVDPPAWRDIDAQSILKCFSSKYGNSYPVVAVHAMSFSYCAAREDALVTESRGRSLYPYRQPSWYSSR